MERASELLVIIVSAVLAVFLLLSIIVVVKLIQILNTLKRITARAEKLADSAEAIGTFFKNAATPITITRILHNITESMFHKGKKVNKE